MFAIVFCNFCVWSSKVSVFCVIGLRNTVFFPVLREDTYHMPAFSVWLIKMQLNVLKTLLQIYPFHNFIWMNCDFFNDFCYIFLMVHFLWATVRYALFDNCNSLWSFVYIRNIKFIILYEEYFLSYCYPFARWGGSRKKIFQGDGFTCAPLNCMFYHICYHISCYYIPYSLNLA